MKIKLKNKDIKNIIADIDYAYAYAYGRMDVKNASFELDLTPEEIEEITKKKEVKLRPENRDKYWMIDAGGNIMGSEWDNNKWDRERLEYGNVFSKKVEAQNELNRRKAIRRIKDYIKKEGLNLGTRIVFVDKDDNTMDEIVFDKFQEDNKDDLEILKEAI